MINKLLLSVRLKIVRAIVVLILLACVIAWLDKMFNFSGRGTPEESQVIATQSSSVASAPKTAFAEQEKIRDEQISNPRTGTAAKTNLTQKMSDECQFWKLQQKKGTSALASTRVKQYCVTPARK